MTTRNTSTSQQVRDLHQGGDRGQAQVHSRARWLVLVPLRVAAQRNNPRPWHVPKRGRA